MNDSIRGGAPPVGIIMGSDSDLPVMQGAADVLDELDVAYAMTIVSAHRTPRRLYEYSERAVERGLKVIIAGAGGAAHLPGMAASLTPLPVIGVPVKTAALNGEDSLLSIVQMPPGVPVATVPCMGGEVVHWITWAGTYRATVERPDGSFGEEQVFTVEREGQGIGLDG